MGVFNSIIRYIFPLAVTLAAGMGMGGCDVLHDDQNGCDLYLRFRYDYNLAREDWFAGQVGAVKVFLFTAEGKYIQTLAESGEALKNADYRMPIPYRLKGCTAVVWAGKTDRFYSLPSLAPGDPIEKLTLKYEPADRISQSHLDTLWHSGPLSLFTNPESGNTETAGLVRNTNDVTVSITRGNKQLDVADFDIVIGSPDAAYNYKNDPMADASRPIIYLPCSEEHAGNTGKASADDDGNSNSSSPYYARLYTLRFVKDRDIDFSITEKSTGKAIDIGGHTKADFIRHLLLVKPEGMGDQEYLDRRYLWDIRIQLGEGDNAWLALSITINNWVYWFHPTDL